MAARLEYMFCLDFTGNGFDEKSKRTALIIGFNRWWIISGLVDPLTGESSPEKASKITHDKYEEYLVLVNQGKYETLLRNVLAIPEHRRSLDNYNPANS